MFADSFSRDAAADSVEAIVKATTPTMMHPKNSTSSTTVNGSGGFALTPFQNGSFVIQ